jgi:hypothetical protein
MSLTSYRAAPSRVKCVGTMTFRREAGCSSALGEWEPLTDIYFLHCDILEYSMNTVPRWHSCAAVTQLGKALLSGLFSVGKGFETMSRYSAVMTCVAL